MGVVCGQAVAKLGAFPFSAFTTLKSKKLATYGSLIPFQMLLVGNHTRTREIPHLVKTSNFCFRHRYFKNVNTFFFAFGTWFACS